MHSKGLTILRTFSTVSANELCNVFYVIKVQRTSSCWAEVQWSVWQNSPIIFSPSISMRHTPKTEPPECTSSIDTESNCWAYFCLASGNSRRGIYWSPVFLTMFVTLQLRFCINFLTVLVFSNKTGIRLQLSPWRFQNRRTMALGQCHSIPLVAAPCIGVSAMM